MSLNLGRYFYQKKVLGAVAVVLAKMWYFKKKLIVYEYIHAHFTTVERRTIRHRMNSMEDLKTEGGRMSYS